MPFSSRKKALVRGDLGIAVDEYRRGPNAFGWIAEKILKPMVVPLQSSEFPVIPIEAMLSQQDTKRAMRGFYNRSDWETEMGFYSTKENGWEELLDERELKLYRNLFDAEIVAVNRAIGIVLRSQEIRTAAKLFNASNFDGDGVNVEWSVKATATPIDDVDTAKKAVRAKCGMIPDTLVLPYIAFENAKRCAQVAELLKYTFPGEDIASMSAAQLAKVLDVQQILVGDEQVNTAKKGKSAVLGEIWNPEYALLTCTAQSESFDEPCVGRIVRWSEESGDGEGGTIVEQYYVDGNRSDVYRVRNDSDELLLKTYDDTGAVKSNIAKSVSYLFSNITA